ELLHCFSPPFSYAYKFTPTVTPTGNDAPILASDHVLFPIRIKINQKGSAGSMSITATVQPVAGNLNNKETMNANMCDPEDFDYANLFEGLIDEASLFCLENDFELGLPPVGACQSIHLHFIALRGNLHSIEAVDIVDVETGGVVELRKFMQVFASG
ncbi:hypothetical protein HDU98_000552, partial [Podochytrium sp. JEL0797]